MHNYKSLEKKLTSVTNYFAERADDTRLQDVKELIEQHGEYGEAYHLLSYLIVENQLPIPKDVYEAIIELGKQMEMEEQSWLPLTRLVSMSRQNET